MQDLKAKEKKKSKVEITYMVEVGSFNAPNFYLLPLFSFFNFNPFFLILPDVIFDNTPLSFL